MTTSSNDWPLGFEGIATIPCRARFTTPGVVSGEGNQEPAQQQTEEGIFSQPAMEGEQ